MGDASFFSTPDGDWFQPTDVCRGPWDPNACHAGPPTGMLIRAAERLLPDQRFVRITVDLLRPIPHAGFRIAGSVVRLGRTVSAAALAIVDADDREVVTARTLHMTTQPSAELPTAPPDTPPFAEARPGSFPIGRAAHPLPMFADATEVRYPPGDDHSGGPTTAWMRTIALLPDDDDRAGVSGYARIAPLADCGNAFSRNAEPGRLVFMNTDLTISLHREPAGEWFGMRSVSRWESDGIGISDSLLFDEHGPVGRAIQSLIIQHVA